MRFLLATHQSYARKMARVLRVSQRTAVFGRVLYKLSLASASHAVCWPDPHVAVTDRHQNAVHNPLTTLRLTRCRQVTPRDAPGLALPNCWGRVQF